MEKKKILILAMSCNKPLFLEQEQNLRKLLYAKDILEHKYDNMDFWTYTASTDGKYHVNRKLHRIEVPASDELEGTYEKTYETFKLLKQLNIEFDYILRTNCSTYINVLLLDKFILNNTDNELNIYSGSIYCTPNSTGPFDWCFYGVGNSLILSKFWVNVIIDNHVSKYKEFNTVINKDEPFYKIDDNTLGLVINSYAYINNINMFSIWHDLKFPAINFIPEDCYNYIIIPFREYNLDNTRNNELNRALYIHENINNNISYDTNIEFIEPNLIHIIDFNRGMHSIVPRYFAEQFLNIMSYPRYIENYLKYQNVSTND